MNHSPNFLTCPSAPELPPPKKAPSLVPQPNSQSTENQIQSPVQTPTPPKTPSLPPDTPDKPMRFYKRFLVIAILLILALLIIPPAISIGRAGFAANSAKQSVDNIKTLVEQGDFEGAKTEAESAQASFDDLHDALGHLGFWGQMPYIGSQVRIVQDAAIVSSQSLDSVQDLLDVASALFEALQVGQKGLGTVALNVSPSDRLKDLSKDEKRRLLQAMYISLPDLRLARDKMDIALTLWDAIPKEGIAKPIKNALNPIAELLPVMKQSLDQAVPLIEVLVPLAGYPDSQNYIIVTQNSDEIRPAGGFIGSAASASVDSAELENFEFYDIYNIDNPASGEWNEVPPQPISDHLGVKAWFMRDANWSPDFPTSAERVLDFYERETQIRTGVPTPRQNGFIAFEPGFFQSLLRFTGPVTARGIQFNEANFMDILQFEVEMGEGITVENRKDLMGEVAGTLINKIQELPSSDWPKLLQIVTTSLEQKQIMVYSRNPDTQKLLDVRGWSARAKPTNGDFLWVIDANLAALKTDGVMKKTIFYELDAREPQKPIARVTLKYTNTAEQFTWRYTRYRSYTRIYVPEGSTLISSKGAMKGDLNQTGGKFVPGQVDVMKELGKTVFGAFWSIEPRHTSELVFTYQLPPTSLQDLESGKYRLDWLKQAGVDNAEFNVKILFPSSVEKASPPEPESKWGDNIYEVQTDSVYDRVFSVSL
ncbi:DUF4012 domain-containing protein [Patescibacteria group bacterium]|nr:DUF4012 domain-containing protein [Patescibacteria group bacterium]